MIDIHCHFLPGIDDGAKTMDEALGLARAAVSNGIECAIMTPHIHPNRYDNVKATIAVATEAFRSALKQANIPLQVGYAAEVRLAPEILQLLESSQVPFLGEVEGYKLMLLEFPHSHIPLGADKLVERLLAQNIRPIIAHPERNKDVMRDLDKIAPFVEMGCLLQLTAASIVSRFGDNAHKRALQLLESDAELVIATDSHNLKARPPILREAMEAATEIVGYNAAHNMVNRLPLAIVASQFANAVEHSPATTNHS
ncbi:MAG: capsular biosynthesis protein [Pseudomonadales bacterium]|nr:capsular biosynthesis protein [Pseudomonadales bacterium]